MIQNAGGARGRAYGRWGQIHLDLEEEEAALADYQAIMPSLPGWPKSFRIQAIAKM